MPLRALLVLGLLVLGCRSYVRQESNLLWYSASGDLARVESLLADGVDKDVRSSGGDTPLLLALRYHHPEIAVALLGQGADVKVVGLHGDTAVHLAASAGYEGIARELLDRGADSDTRNAAGDTPLFLAMRNGHQATAVLLVSNGVALQVSNPLGDTPLHVAYYFEQTDVAELMIAKGADSTVTNRFHVTPPEMSSVFHARSEVDSAAALIGDDGEWRDRWRARSYYDSLRARDARYVVNALAYSILGKPERRAQVLVLAVKLGVPGTEAGLSMLLTIHGDKWMAEDFINSGSDALDAAGREWAARNGYTIRTGPGSHRAAWRVF